MARGVRDDAEATREGGLLGRFDSENRAVPAGSGHGRM